MDFTPVTQEQRKQFKEHGYLIVPNAISGALQTRLEGVSDRFMKLTDPIHNFYSNRYIDLTLDEALIELSTNSRIVPLIIQLLSYNIQLMRGHIIYKYPQPASNEPVVVVVTAAVALP